MCDYSLHLVVTRPAEVGDKLVSTKFVNALTRGFAAVGEPSVAVCLSPGTEVAFENDVEYDTFFSVPPRKLRQRVARFRKVNEHEPKAHHDALEFPDGQILILNRLCEGQRATVLQLPVAPYSTTEANERASIGERRELTASPM